MSKRIFRNIVSAAVLSVLLTAILIVPALYNAHEESLRREIRQQTESIACALNLTNDDTAYLAMLHADSRLTLIASDGTVLFDSMTDAVQMENHLERPEVVQALQTGEGESVRLSDTLSETTFYCTRRLEDGCVLRIANTRRSMLGTFISVFPLISGMLIGVSLLSVLIAHRAARKIVSPINALDLDAPLENEAYDELAPLLTRMQRQHEQIDQQLHALESAHMELTAIMQNMREGMVLLDKNENILSMNESAARIFDATPQKSIGRNLLNVYRNAELHDKVCRALGGACASLPLERGGRQYELYLSPVLKDASVRGAVLLILDVTERFAAEQSRKEFTANVSHELKTPLTSISGFAEIIRDGIAQPKDIQRFAGMICRESTRLIALVNDILELSRLDEQKSLRIEEMVAILPMLRELMGEFSPAAEKKQQTFCVSGDDAAIVGDPSLLRELFSNLIDNAIKYTPEHGKVSLSVKADGEKVICTVSDNGIGISAEHQAHVFERFYRVDKSHSRKSGGTGLGLAIVKHIAQIHKAEICMQSAPDAGTEIQVVLKAYNDNRS